MLQKILVVLVGLIMSVVGALSPEGLLASRNEGADGPQLAGNVAEETLATLRTSDGQAFARISVLWAEVDGRRVTEDAWGTGEVEELRFKVGVKGVEDAALAVGSKVVELHPTDIITIRMFRGDFSYRGLGTPLATLQLQGTVKTTVLRDGDLDNRVLTKIDGIVEDASSDPGGEEKVAYVVLTTGQKVDTVAVEDGGSRLFTEEASAATAAKNEPGNLLAKWVKVDGRLVQEYTWGDGTLAKVEFEPAESASRSVVLAFNGETYEVPAGERIVVEDFVGEYLMYQVSGGLVRVRLDGYARAYQNAPALPDPQQGGEGAPLTSFEFAPQVPRTTDTVQFRDRTTDDGIPIFRHWDFGDNSSSVVQDPTHRYERPGTYEVTLSVTDNDLKTSNMTRTIIIRNTDPVTDFDFSPHIVTTDTLVSFSDQSYDPDGTLAGWSWDFGDGTTSTLRHPTHRFTRGGNVTVTATVTDDLGGRSSLSKVILVRNTPPLAGFSFSPGSPLTLDPIQFISNSTDTDGQIVNWNWSFGDGRYGAGSSPVHAYERPGLYTVGLTVTDDAGDADTASTIMLVGNRPPFAEFVWNPDGQAATIPLSFTSQASDPDGLIVLQRWSWGDGSVDSIGTQATHTFPGAGTYLVTLTVTDNTLGVSNVTRSVTVANSAPRANMVMAPNPTYRGVPVTFSDSSVDPDGDAITNFTWELGTNLRYGRVIVDTFDAIGSYPITLTVTDEEGQTSSITRTLRVLNRPPTVTVDFTPRSPTAGEPVSFTATAVDPDLEGGAVNVSWVFSDGPTEYGSAVTRTFARQGNYSATVRGTDSEGGESAPQVVHFTVNFAKPVADFTWDPLVPVPNEMVNFTDQSTSANGPIREWRWDLGDGGPRSISSRTTPSYAYREDGSYLVRLEVKDSEGQTGSVEKLVVVNVPPIARIIAPGGILQLNAPVEFQDDSIDPDGAVVNWSWNFGDGTTSDARHPTHPGFATPGAYTVRLTVTDDRGTTDTDAVTLNVANTPPVANWDHSPLTPARGQPVSFFGYDHSFDPDGSPLTQFEWTFGDGTPATGGPDMGNVTHSFLRSGRYLVGLKVADGAGMSLRTPLSHQPLNVTPEHSVQLNIKGIMPDGSIAPITLPPYAVSVRVGNVAVDGSQFYPNGDVMEVNVDPSLWVHGDAAVVRVSAPFLAGVNEQSVILRDGVSVIDLTFPLRMAVRAELEPAPGNEISLLAILGADEDYGGDPLYSDMTEKPHGTGVIIYADGSRAEFQRVHIEARWVPLRALGGSRNVTENSETAGAFPNFCKAGDAMSDANGAFNWSLDGESPCYLNAIANGVYPVGRWEVRARPQVAAAENRLGSTQVFYVDPTGGLLLRASLGLA